MKNICYNIGTVFYCSLFILCFVIAVALFAGCTTPQAEASGAYIAAEVATAQLLQTNPGALPALKLLTADWTKYQGGTLTSADEATLLQAIVTATKQKLTLSEAALLDGATQQIIANTNTTAPTPVGGAAFAIVSDVMNGISRELVIYTPPAS